MDAFRASEARGRRKFIRASCNDDFQATLNYKDETEEVFHGKLLDISSAGFAVKIENFSRFPLYSLFRNVQLKLHASLIMANAVLLGNRRNERDTYALLFDPRMRDIHKSILHRYIKDSLQRYINRLSI